MVKDPTSLSAARRRADLEALADGEPVDVLVIGGGVTGAGVALDAASRGLSVALLERRDLAFGTSRWSSKLVHGGLRYMSSGHFGLAWEAARERAILLDHTAPHLVRPLPMLVALTDEVSPTLGALVELAARVSDGMRLAAGTSRRRLPRPRRIGVDEARRLAPGLAADRLRGAVLMWDGQLEDDARLVIALARTAAAHGARVLTYAPVTRIDPDGARALDACTGEAFHVRARHVVNATGVWADTLTSGIELRPSRGSHLLVAAERLGDPRAAVSVPLTGDRARWAIVVPRPDGTVMIGLTDEAVTGPPGDRPEVEPYEEELLLKAVGRALEVPLGPEDVIGRFAGLRPLAAGGGAASADLSRRHAIVEDPETAALTITGGKLTTYRRMAEDVVDRVAARPDVAAGPCRTRRLALLGAASPRQLARLRAPGRLVARYGSEAPRLVALAAERPELLEPLAPGLPVLGVELRFGLDHELALGAEDLLDRRTRLGLVPEQRRLAEHAARRLFPELETAVLAR